MRKLSGDNSRLLDHINYMSREPSRATNIRGEQIMVRDTFPFNPDSKTAGDTAGRWGQAGYGQPECTPTLVSRVNEPFSVIITDLDVRSEGGRAYKVIDEEMHRFDLREDQVIEVMKYTGISPGGVIPGKFVWGILGSQIRLVLVGGDLHKKMTENAEAKKTLEKNVKEGKTPNIRTFEVGHIYRKPDKSLHAFIGRVKLSGSEKTFYAFIELPEQPERYDNCGLDEGETPKNVYDSDPNAFNSYTEKLRGYRKFALSWDTLSWEEKFKYSEKDRYAESGSPNYECPTQIVLMSSPSFEAEEPGYVDVTKFQMNMAGRHLYTNGKGEELAERYWEETQNGGRRRGQQIDSGMYGWNRPRYEQEKAVRDAEYIAARKHYRDCLIWV